MAVLLYNAVDLFKNSREQSGRCCCSRAQRETSMLKPVLSVFFNVYSFTFNLYQLFKSSFTLCSSNSLFRISSDLRMGTVVWSAVFITVVTVVRNVCSFVRTLTVLTSIQLCQSQGGDPLARVSNQDIPRDGGGCERASLFQRLRQWELHLEEGFQTGTFTLVAFPEHNLHACINTSRAWLRSRRKCAPSLSARHNVLSILDRVSSSGIDWWVEKIQASFDRHAYAAS